VLVVEVDVVVVAGAVVAVVDVLVVAGAVVEVDVEVVAGAVVAVVDVEVVPGAVVAVVDVEVVPGAVVAVVDVVVVPGTVVTVVDVVVVPGPVVVVGPANAEPASPPTNPKVTSHRADGRCMVPPPTLSSARSPSYSKHRAADSQTTIRVKRERRVAKVALDELAARLDAGTPAA
jgi:hypothetical protein